MGKRAKKSTRSQERPESQLRLRLAEFVRRNLMTFVIQEGMKALDRVLEDDRAALCGAAHSKRSDGQAVRWGHTDGRHRRCVESL